MPLDTRTDRVVDALIAALVDEGDSDTYLGPTVSVPKNLASVAADHGLDDGSLQLRGRKTAWLFQVFKTALAEDESLEHLSIREREALRSDIVWRTYIAQQTMPSVPTGRVVSAVKQAFIAEHVPVQKAHRVFCEIEGLSVDRDLDISGVCLQTLTSKRRTSLLLELGGEAKWAIDDIPDGSTLALVVVKANSFVQARRLGGYEIDDALSMLRCSTLKFGVRVHDEQLLFARGAEIFVESDGEVWRYGTRPRQRIGIEVVDQFRDYVDTELEWMSEVNKYQGGLRDQLVRSVHWIGSSIQRESHDDKIIDLCTAIECLLTTQQDVKKAEPICVRYMALSILAEDGCYHLDRIYDLYRGRSRVVHGSARLIGDEEGYRTLQTVAIDMLQQVLIVLKRDVTITRHSKLLRALDERPLRERCLAWCEKESTIIPPEVVNYLRKGLEEPRDDSVDRSVFPPAQGE
ncbi:MAG: HEPN domain-containing protein [Thermomicrobiales bacterium]